jgi:hypothetical protein
MPLYAETQIKQQELVIYCFCITNPDFGMFDCTVGLDC